MALTQDEFLRVIDATPLVAIDLIIRNESGHILLGMRRNRPAQNYWFVPGGRIRKNERLQDAFKRIGQAELGLDLPQGKLLGAFDHLYADNYYGAPGIGTHYVTLGYLIDLKGSSALKHDDQHAELKWWSPDALLRSDSVHENTKIYLSTSPDNGFRCDAA
jgi:colanic acid biosynthesis protein WcaH